VHFAQFSLSQLDQKSFGYPKQQANQEAHKVARLCKLFPESVLRFHHVLLGFKAEKMAWRSRFIQQNEIVLACLVMKHIPSAFMGGLWFILPVVIKRFTNNFVTVVVSKP
jgi:hypothetical protein